MKKITFYFLVLCNFSFSQSTEHFDESVGATSFTNNSQIFNITSQAGIFDIYDSGGSNYGWTGSTVDAKFIDNSGSVGTNRQFTISANGGTDFVLNNFYLYVGDASANLGVSGTVTLTGKKNGSTVYTASSSTHNTSLGVNNGFTFVNLTNYGGSNNSNILIDELVIAANTNIQYLALDAWNWSTGPEINLKGNSTNIADGDASPTATDHTDFGSQSACSGTIVRTFTIENTGQSALSVSSATLSGTHAADFSVSSAPGSSVAGGGTTTFQVTFNPSATGTRSATLTVNNGDGDEGTYDFAIQGTGTDPEVNLQGNGNSMADGDATPSSTDHTDFGSQSICSGTIIRTFTIQNTGTSTLSVSNPTISGTHAGDFSISANPSATVVAAGSTTFNVTFNPSAAGTRTATITFTNGDCDEATYDFAIQGTGTDPEVNLQGNGNSIGDGDATPSSVDHTDFGSQDLCSGTIVRTFTIQNTGNSTLNLANPTLSGTHAADFSVTANPSATVAAAGSTTFQVTFNPSAAGTRSATVTFTSDDCDEATYDFAIQGTGTDGTPNADAPSNVTACDLHSLSALSVGNYFSGSGGTGTSYFAGNNINGTMTMYVYAVNGSCSDENSFTITINTTPTADALSNVSACSSHTLATLSSGNYFSGSGGTGTPYVATDDITSSMTMYVYAETGTTPNCANENSFTITINDPVIADDPSDVRACATYELPSLSAGNNYYTGVGGTGTMLSATDDITTTQTLYVRMVDGACSNESSMLITIFDCIELAPASCNSTLVNMSDAIYAETVPGATEYRFKIEHTASSYVNSMIQTSNSFRLSWFTASPVKYGTTYTIYTSAKVGGLWMPFENACSVTTPATQLLPSHANSTLNSLTDALNSYQVAGATNYAYEVRKVSDNSLVGVSYRGASDNLFRLSWLSGTQNNTSYKIRVSAYVGSSWQAFGPSVTVNTPLITKLSVGTCGASVTDLTQQIYCDAVAGATNYRYEIRRNSDQSLIAIGVRGSADNWYRLSWRPEIQLGQVYSIKVSAYVDGGWKPYGSACTVFTYLSMQENNDPKELEQIENKLFSLETYPNPNDGNFTISSSHEGTFNIINELGQLIQKVEITKDNNYQTKVENLRQGVYFVTGTINNELITKKVVVQ